jgi:hypothetical protein
VMLIGLEGGGSIPPILHHGGTLYVGYRLTRFES